LHARIDFFEYYNTHFFLSIHHNAGAAKTTGHTAIYKKDVADVVLYEGLAKAVNAALEGVVQGPKLKLLTGNYHLTRETLIPGTISEAGFMTNPEFDEQCNQPDFPKKEAAALAKGLIYYWQKHRDGLMALQVKLKLDRDAKPRNPRDYTATALNPAYQAEMKQLLEKLEPSCQFRKDQISVYLQRFQKEVVAATDQFQVKAILDGERIELTGSVSNRKNHDRLIDVLVALKWYQITNRIELPKPVQK
jgi:N-acetylmuramoyl-L-alanine amidase